MVERQYRLLVAHGESQYLTVTELATCAGIDNSDIERYVEMGLLSPIAQDAPMVFVPSMATRLRSILRLQHDLGINLAGVSVVLDLVDKLRALQAENAKLRKRGFEDLY